ncbi:MAG: hypothetical protein DA408_13865 [Bacteroidetes bacterium]|nr:MAG: hypothetical protein C7N36_11880 [Bacteroidota bacterium]PTM11316.1 MAG: hypothetical protein DA408_13865 [Bacteroidota bacterium]
MLAPCCAAISAASYDAPKAAFPNVPEVVKDDCAAIFTCHLFLPVSPSERSVNPLVNPAPSSTGKQLQSPGLAATLKTQPGTCPFSQYTALARDFPVRHRKANLIFPFHYFW